MKLEQLANRLLPESIQSGPKDVQRRATLLIYAVSFCVVTPLPVALILHALGKSDLAGIVLLGAIPSAAAVFLLKVTKSVSFVGHYLTAWVFLQTALDFGPDNGFSVLAILAIPIISCSLIGERAGTAWTIASVAWVVSIALQTSPTDQLYFGLMWSTAVVVAAIGIAVVVLEQSRTQARIDSENANSALLSQRERLLAFAENSFPAIAETINNRMLYVSRGISEILEYSTEEFMERPLNSYVHPEELPAILQQLEQISVKGMHYEARLRHKQGHWVWLELFAIPYGPGEGRWIFAGRNIDTEKKQREIQQQSQRLESVGLLAAGMAHDFNNLLTVTMGFSELLPASESRDQIISATGEAAKLTQQLTSFARTDGTGPAATDVNRLGRNLKPSLKNIMGDSIEVHLQGAENSLFAAIATGQLHQVLLNLATNAKTAMPQGGELTISTKKIEIQPSDDGKREYINPGSYVEILITDTGLGMDAYTEEHAFDPFFSTKPGSRRSGLGLTSVYGIISNVGGHITLTSAQNEGTQVQLLIPLANEILPPMELKVDENATNPIPSDKTLLVIEEDVSVRSLLVYSLEREGYSVEAAKNVPAALNIANTLEPDLLITDNMATLGTNPIARLQEKFPNMSILCTGNQAEQGQETLQIPTNIRYLAKPFRSGDLLGTVRDMLRRSSTNL